MSETKRTTMMQETVFLSAFSVILQGMGLLLNIFLTRRLGAASVGALTLIGSFYGLAAVLSGGSGFIAASRFLSEELGCGGNPKRVFAYTAGFCLTLSSTAAGAIFLFARQITGLIAKTGAGALTVRILSLTLPVSALTACLKGRCYAYQKAFLPAVAECIEFILRAGILAFFTVFFIPYGKATILTAFAVSMLAGQGIAALFLLLMPMPHRQNSNPCSVRFSALIRLMLPVMGNTCLVSLLSSANDALVPLTLLQYGNSTEQALAQFGEFEAIIIPALFFPSVVQCCMSGLMVPELSRARAAHDSEKIRLTTRRVLEQTVTFSFFIVMFLAQFGKPLGRMLGGNAQTGRVLQLMAPVVPFIYIEIILEGIIRGLGKQNFSSVNYLGEYIVRISVLLMCVPMFGFYGIVASYMACNLAGNSVRICYVLRTTGLRPGWKRMILRPAFAVLLSWQISVLIGWILQRFGAHELPAMVICTGCAAVIYGFLLRVLHQFDMKETDLCGQNNMVQPEKS
ncbi:MAG: polysaccharide biosynthesis C-terminal domain-containing protein [Oscillospiraceae bacterium]|nr:polysaccharide biosynthesis C-terminal domain-containing protein [Oscillospiraceae bacterium]